MYKYGFYCIAITILVLFLTQCKRNQLYASSVSEDAIGNLIPYIDYDNNGGKIWGYVHADSFEIVIEAKYKEVTPFVGGFAVVTKPQVFKALIINKNEDVVLSGSFNKVYLLVSESGKNHLALLRYDYTRTRFRIGISLFGASTKTGFYTEDYSKFSLVNLSNGKTLIRKKENYLNQRIELISDYCLADENLYQFLDNGDVELISDKENRPFGANILREYLARKNINANVSNFLTIEFEPYFKEKYAEPDLSGAFDALKTQVPNFPLQFEKASPFYRDHRFFLDAPLEISERKYLLSFRDEKDRHAIGIYNETKAEWELLPFYRIQETDEVMYFITHITQTNYSNYYYLLTKKDSSDWNDSIYTVHGGGIYDAYHHNFLRDFYLFDTFRLHNIQDFLTPDRAYIKIPDISKFLVYDTNITVDKIAYQSSTLF